MGKRILVRPPLRPETDCGEAPKRFGEKMQSVVKTLVKKQSKLIDLGTAADRRAIKNAAFSKDFSKELPLIDFNWF